MYPRICILGDGLLGRYMHEYTGWDYISRAKDGFDITRPDNWDQYFIGSAHGVAFYNKYDVLLNCIAYTDTYSPQRKHHWDVNFKGVVDLADYCNDKNIKLVHMSTDYVYANSIPNAQESDVPMHCGTWYGYTKLLGDAYAQIYPKNLVIRATHKREPFPYEYAWINQVGNFDYVSEIAKIIKRLIEIHAEGLFNVGTELKSMYELAKKTREDVEPIMTFDNLVPNNTSMNINKLKRKLG